MTQEGCKRKLTAIISADVKGYSRLMGDPFPFPTPFLTPFRSIICREV